MEDDSSLSLLVRSPRILVVIFFLSRVVPFWADLVRNRSHLAFCFRVSLCSQRDSYIELVGVEVSVPLRACTVFMEHDSSKQYSTTDFSTSARNAWFFFRS